MKRTKIVATIGPTSDKKRTLEAMMEEGMNICRLNFSHGDYKWHEKVIGTIRAAEKKTGKKIGIMADIQGPRVRVASHKNLKLVSGEKIYLTDQKSPHNKRYKKEILLDWDQFYHWIRKKSIIYIEDGLIQLEVTKVIKTGCVAEVLVGGTVKPHKGVNIPSISSHMGFLTDKDLDDLEFILSQDIDFIAASFVACGKDIESLRQVIEYLQVLGQEGRTKKRPRTPWIISKIERKKAIKNIEKIIKASDGIMVARGDLAIEMPQEKVAIFQKDIIFFCLKHRKPVIVATQMMTSMLEKARPTRAEISDVTNAVVDNADAVMFSNETAVGKRPVDVVEIVSKIIEETEKSTYNDRVLIRRNKFAKLISRKKKGRKKSMKAKNLEELLGYSSLRQEDIRLSLSSRKSEDKRKAALIWGA